MVAPYHIAIIMDGNGRWAKRRLLPRLAGHKQGLEALRRCMRACRSRGVQVLTVFAFSSENWARPSEEVNGLLKLMSQALIDEVDALVENQIALHVIGDISTLSASMQMQLEQAQRRTQVNYALILNVCFNYGGRWDIVQAAQRLADQGLAFNEHNFHANTALSHVPDPDVLIRTAGEVRISNFLLWQLAYTELVFSSVLWPDFSEVDLDAAIAEYGQRERRYGKTSEQLVAPTAPASIEALAGKGSPC